MQKTPEEEEEEEEPSTLLFLFFSCRFDFLPPFSAYFFLSSSSSSSHTRSYLASLSCLFFCERRKKKKMLFLAQLLLHGRNEARIGGRKGLEKNCYDRNCPSQVVNVWLRRNNNNIQTGKIQHMPAGIATPPVTYFSRIPNLPVWKKKQVWKKM